VVSLVRLKPDLAHALDDVAGLTVLGIGHWLTRMANTVTAGGSCLRLQDRDHDRGNIWRFCDVSILAS